MAKQIVWDSEMVAEAAEKINNGFVLSKFDSPFYEKTVGLRRAGVAYKMEDWERDEYIKCALDIHYFSEKYCYIKGEDGQPQIIILRDYQKEILDNFNNNRFNILMASRQVGKCFSFNSKVLIKIEDRYLEVRFGKLYYSILMKQRKLTIFERLKIKLYDLLYRIEN